MSSPAAASHWHYSPPLLRHRWRRTPRFFSPLCTSSSSHPTLSCFSNKLRLQQRFARSYASCVACWATMKPEPESDEAKDKHEPDSPELLDLKNSIKNINGIFGSKISVQDDDDMDVASGSLLPGMKDKHEPDSPELLGVKDSINNTDGDFASEISVQEKDDVMDVASGSPLPGMKNIGESIRIPKATIDILKDQVFGFDTFFVTKQEPYEGGLLFRGNLRGKAAKSYEKITKRMQDRFGDLYKFFLLTDPEDDKPVAVVVPKQTFQAEVTAVPEWFAACAFGVVTIFTLLLRNVPALQLNLLSLFENPELLKDGLPGSIVTSLILLSHEAGHFLVARDIGVKLGVPYFVPSWQIGSFGAITRILSIVANREDLLKLAAAGPLVGFVAGLAFLILGLILPPTDGIGVIVDSAVFHESFLAGGIAKLVLGDALKEGTPISLNPLVLWSWAGLLINAINMIPTGDLDGGRISFALWGRKVYARLSAVTLALLGISSLFSDVAFYWTVLIFFLQRGPISPLYEEITEPGEKYIGVGVAVLVLGLLICLPYPFPFFSDGTNFVL